MKIPVFNNKRHARPHEKGAQASAEISADVEELEDGDASDWDDQLAGQDFVVDKDNNKSDDEGGAEQTDDHGV